MRAMPDHPGEPRGSDTVPAWLTPGEFVVNAEAMRDPQNAAMVESINDQGRAMQAMQGGSIPTMYQKGGKVAPRPQLHHSSLPLFLQGSHCTVTVVVVSPCQCP